LEASEAGRRIFWRHRWLLLILMIVPALAIVPLKERQAVTYAATATIQGQGTTPDATTQVTAIQSRVSAVATDPGLVGSVLSQAKVNLSAVQVARHNITVTPLSSSAIMNITVTNPNPQVAIDLAGLLANAVVTQLNELGVKDNPELAALAKTDEQLAARRDQLLAELAHANASNASTSVSVQSLLSQLGATEQELATNESQSQQVLATLTTETGASVVSVPAYASGVSRHVAVDAALAALLGLVLGLLFATLREVMRPTVAEPAAGARELGAVLLGSSDERRGKIVRLDPDLPERLSLAAHRAGVLTVVLTGPGSRTRLAALAARLRAALPTPERADARARARVAGRLDHDETSTNGDGRRPAIVGSEHRTTDFTIPRAKPYTTVVTLDDIRLGAPPPDAALVVALPRFAPHSALDQAADLGLTADWPILGVIGIRRRGLLASLFSRSAGAPDLHVLDTRFAANGSADTFPDLPVAGVGPADAAAKDIAPAGLAADAAHDDKPKAEKAKTPDGIHQEGTHD
jgi:capsular polysaccharide biosynthesis protein